MLKGSHCYCYNKNHLTDLHHGVAAYIVYIGDMKLTVSRCCDDHTDLMTLHTNQLCFLASNPASLCNCILSGQSLGCCLCTGTVGWLCQLVECNLLLKITKKLLTNPANTLRQSWRGDSYLHNGAKIDMWQQIILAESPFYQKYRETR